MFIYFVNIKNFVKILIHGQGLGQNRSWPVGQGQSKLLQYKPVLAAGTDITKLGKEVWWELIGVHGSVGIGHLPFNWLEKTFNRLEKRTKM